MSVKRKLNSLDLAGEDIIIRTKKAANARRQQRYRDTHTNSEDYKTRNRIRNQIAKDKKNSDENSLILKHCSDMYGKSHIETPVGSIRYSQSRSHFELLLTSDSTPLNSDNTILKSDNTTSCVKGCGSYGLVVMKGKYCYKINVATQGMEDEANDGSLKINFYFVDEFKLPKEKVDRSRFKSIRFSKGSNISFEKDSLYDISKVKELRQCTAPYVGKSANIICYLDLYK